MGGGQFSFRNNKKGFTLLEVLAVIIVLAVIALITIPIVSNVMAEARKNSFTTSMNNLVHAANNYYADNQLAIDKVMTFCFGLSGSNCTSEELSFTGKEPTKGKLVINPDGEVSLIDVSDGKFYANYDSSVDDEIVVTEDNEVLNRDELTQAVKDLQKKLEDTEKKLADKDKALQAEIDKKSDKTELDKVKTELASTTKIANTANNTANSLNNNMLNKTYPVGSIYISYNSTNPASLFGGTWVNYGSGRVLKGISSGTAGGTGGSSTVTLSTANLPSHSHTVTAKGSVSSSFTGSSATTSSAGSHTHSFSGTTSNNGSHTHRYPLDGTGNPSQSWPAWTLMSKSWVQINATATKLGADTASAGSHTHTISGTTGSAGSHTHTLTAKGTVKSTFTGSSATTSSVGSGSAINVQDPYITVYMWRRTA